MKRNESSDSTNSKKPKLRMGEDQQAKKEEFFQPVGQAAEEVDHEQVPENDNDGIRMTGAEDAQGHPVQEIDSLCMNCHETGVSRLLLTSIPYFREIVVISFECPHCGFKNSEIQPASTIAEKGSRYVLKIENKEDFNRQVVKSDYCTCKFIELDIEIPAKRGQLTTVEGLLSEMVEDLEMDQPQRKEVQPEIYEKIEQFLAKIRSVLNGETGLPLTFLIDDPSGNSWIEYVPGEPQHKWSVVEYNRTPQQNVMLGLVSADEVAAHEQEQQQQQPQRVRATGFMSDETDIENFANEVQVFHATCSSCYAPCETHMKVVNIPHFKDVIIMSTTCERCGYKSNEVKTGGAVPDRGKRVTLYCDDPEDLTRDILKSETCGLKIPELNLDLTPGTLGGRFTTLEGLLRQVRDELHSRVFQETSDSMTPESKANWEKFFERLDTALAGKMKFTVIMEDPLASSYIQNVYAPDDDPNMKVEEFERTREQNEELGLLDMKVD
ncbi:Zinc finger protein zpr1 [Ogataea parapolymorpha DL-1]|uniref:Zinc finger protein zpr1 n=1 Tax=Ogataea parapolymorpha (strain ATCC 26012 / BCRC 20466 / JCM 22074 / NRRL Y-7560 / DL-1) TaxID=871575 RepID=W1QIA2_OGAPD|nr:Zinc finger protein zpr1 [Ogataea parapolymorpha DL-1]ESX02039.1 Zinc finger protein zpr1 [Ogataea parapolymorpha DL-1]